MNQDGWHFDFVCNLSHNRGSTKALILEIGANYPWDELGRTSACFVLVPNFLQFPDRCVFEV